MFLYVKGEKESNMTAEEEDVLPGADPQGDSPEEQRMETVSADDKVQDQKKQEEEKRREAKVGSSFRSLQTF